MSSYRPVTAVLRGLEVLRVVNRSGLASIKVIHQETGFNKATIVRMLETLIHAGYVSADPVASAYRATGRVKQLSAGYANYDKMAEICAPILETLREAVGWPSDFTIRDDDAMIVVRSSRQNGPFNFNRNPGFRAPILLTSIGKVYLAFCSAAEREEILVRLQDTTAKLPSRARIDRMLDQVRTAGFAVMEDAYSQREYKGAILAIAAPVRGANRIYGSINLMFLRQVGLDEVVKRYIESLQQAAEKISQALAENEL